MSENTEETQSREISAEARQANSAKAMDAAKILAQADEQTEVALAPFASARSFAVALRMADNLADSTFVPEKFRGKPADLLFAMDIAHRTGMGLLPVLQSVYFVGGKPGFEAKFLIACLNGTRRFSAIDYEEGGEGDGQYCIAFATDLKTNKVKRGTKITIALAKAEGWYARSGSKWKTMPDQMLRYRAAAFFIRAFAPDVALGMQTVDELQDTGGSIEGTLAPIDDGKPAVPREPADFGVKPKSAGASTSAKDPPPADTTKRAAPKTETASAPTKAAEKPAAAAKSETTLVVDGATVDKKTGEILTDPKADPVKPAAIDGTRNASLDAAIGAIGEMFGNPTDAPDSSDSEPPTVDSLILLMPANGGLSEGMANMVRRKLDSAAKLSPVDIARFVKQLGHEQVNKTNLNDVLGFIEANGS